METALHSPGRPLDTEVRSLMEQRFGRSFRHVRVHTGTEPAASARALDADAYTVGPDIVFGSGRYLPATSHGRGLLAHELAHVLQQEGAHRTEPGLGDEGVTDRQADVMARAAARGEPVPMPAHAGRRVMRATRTFSLTFDDGPHTAPLGGGENRTENVLDELKARSVKAGFFVETAVRMANPVGRALVSRMQEDGHKVGLHSAGVAPHERHTEAEKAGRLEPELRAGKAAIKKVTGNEPTLVRPPYGKFNEPVKATYVRLGLTSLLWDIDGDKDAKSLADLKNRIEAGIAEVQRRGWKTSTPSPTIVVLLHDIRENTAKNVGAIIDHIKATVAKITGGKDSAGFSAP